MSSQTMSGAENNRARRRMSVREVMSDNFKWVDNKDTVMSAITTMRNAGLSVLIVHKRNDNDEFGIVVPADIAKKVLAIDRSPERVNVYEIMTKPVITVQADMDIRYCARLFDQFGLHVAPVQDPASNSIIGVVSYDDIVLRGLAENTDGQ